MKQDILQDLSYGMYVVGTKEKGEEVGCIANSAMQITSTPVTIAISLNHQNATNQAIKESGQFSLSILNEQTKKELIQTFGYFSSKDKKKYEGIEQEEVSSLPVIKDSNGYLLCRVVATLETTTHTIFLGEVFEKKRYQELPPMTYAYYHQVLKGTTPKKAPTYQEEKNHSEKRKWRCKICGYIYEGDELKEDFVCPLCGATANMFEKI